MPFVFLNTSKSAQFYRLKDAGPSNTAVSDLFKWASRKRDGNAVERRIRDEVQTGHGLAHVSYLCFKQKIEPPFLSGSRLKERRYAFLLLIEVAETLAVFKRYADVSEEFLRKVAEPFGYEDLGGVYVEGNAAFERLSLRGMALGGNSVRARSLEAANLGRAMSTFGINRSLPRSFRTRSARDGNPFVNTVTPGTSRVARREARVRLPELISWVAETGNDLRSGAQHYEGSFLANFCRPVPLKQLPNTVVPTALLLDSTQLEEALHEEHDEPVIERLRVRGQENRVMPSARALKLLDRMSEVLLVDGDTIYYEATNGKRVPIGRVEALIRAYRIRSELLDRIHVTVPEGSISLERWLNKHQAFTIAFSEPRYAYADGQLFEDRRLLDSIPQLLEIIQVVPELTTTTGEKNPEQTGFGNDSVFHVVETQLAANAGALLCDDLMDEWADYVEFSYDENLPRLVFYHCKHGDLTTSASKFQDVIGQAVKNLSRLHASYAEFEARWSGSWNGRYTAAHPFPRLRIGDPATVPDEMRQVVNSARTQREVVLVVSFMSKATLTAELNDLRRGEARPHISQLLWFLSGFVGSCREHSVLPKIVCQP
jgi:hypothetical protein